MDTPSSIGRPSGRPSAVLPSAVLPSLPGVTLHVEGAPDAKVELPPLEGIEVQAGAQGDDHVIVSGWKGCAPAMELAFDDGSVRRVTTLVNVTLHPPTEE